MTNDIITLVFNVLLSLVFFAVKLILLPIDLFIQQFIPGLTDAFTAVGQFLQLIAQGLGWAISATGIPYAGIALIATYYIFKLTLPINIWFIKLALKWWRTLKP